MISHLDKRKKVSGGFSLLEVLVALAIVTILAGVAYPLYVNQAMQGKRAEGAAMLLQIAIKEEAYFQNYGRYTEDMTELGFSSDPVSTANGFYTIDAAFFNVDQGFLLTATRAASHVNDTVCGDLTYSSLDIRSAINHTEPNPAEQCWQ